MLYQYLDIAFVAQNNSYIKPHWHISNVKFLTQLLENQQKLYHNYINKHLQK